MLRKLIPRDMPSLSQAVSSPRAAIEQAIESSPLAPARAHWNSFRDLEEWWLLVIPLLVWVFWRTYKGERARFLARPKAD